MGRTTRNAVFYRLKGRFTRRFVSLCHLVKTGFKKRANGRKNRDVEGF
jgi:hypothetical protein